MALTTTIAERIGSLLSQFGPLDDDVLAERLGIVRQSVNQTCRRLEQRGALRRYVGGAGKIVNDLVEPGEAPTNPRLQSPPPAIPPAAASGRITEDEVKQAVADHLKGRGYTVHVAWGRTRGIDIDATRPRNRLVIEAKGEAPAGPQQVNYFLGALGELVQRMNDDDAEYGLALPDHKQYRGLVNRLPRLARDRLRLRVFFVSRTASGMLVEEA